MNTNRANFLICYSPKFPLYRGMLSLISICMELIVKKASERARPHAQSLKIKPLAKHQFSNLVQMSHIIYQSTQNHETNSAMHHLSSYLQGIRISIQKTKILSVFGHFCQIDFIRFNLFLHFQKLEVISH